MFVDLGFLKYFNTGGREVGNLAIQSTAEVLEEALAELGKPAEAFRYAGDEFTILFVGSDEDQMKLIEAIETAKKSKGALPRTDKSSPLYRPEEIVINYGTATRETAEQIMQTLLEKDVLTETFMEEKSDEYYERVANIQTRIADLGVEAQKAQSRFVKLMKAMRHDFPKDFPEKLSLDQRATDVLVKFSQKAIFGMPLTELHAFAYNPDYDLTTVQGFQNLQAHINSKKEYEEMITDNQRKVEDAVVENHLRELSVNKEINEHIAKISILREENNRLHARINDLQQQQHDAEAIRLLQDELARHSTQSQHLEANEQHLSRLQAEKQALLDRRQQITLQPPIE
jgi:GGDEF domain-containing protein/uncharacterized small protein (DUF1192 family)